MIAAALVLLALAVLLGRRVIATVLTLRALAFTPRMSRRLALWLRPTNHSPAEFLRADGADEPWAEIRKQAINRLAGFFQTEYAKSIAWSNGIRQSFSDLRFTDANRVPFPFAQFMREHFSVCSVVTASAGPQLRDLDGHWTLDVSGSYGLNVAGFDRYKEWMQRGLDRVKELGPVLGPLHPIVADNIRILKSISKLDEVSFHMSGTRQNRWWFDR